MQQYEGKPGDRSLAVVAQELTEAEKIYADADARWKKAQADRLEALQKINDHQAEIDDLVEKLRKRSIPGARWYREAEEYRDTLEVSLDDVVVEAAAKDWDRQEKPLLRSKSAEDELAENFHRLRKVSSAQGDDPVLKVAYGSKG